MQANNQRKLWWPDDGSDEWLHPIDGRLAVILLEFATKRTTSSEIGFLEIGVYKGAWASVLLKNLDSVRGQGIDPYPGRAGFKEALISRLDQIGVSNRFELFASWEDFSQQQNGPDKLSLIHIDGEHSESAVWADLHLAEKYLADQGILVVDDYRHFWFPGIASAVYRFVYESEFRLIALTENKAYLVRAGFHAEMQEQLRPIIEDEIGMRVWKSWREWDPHREFFQSSDVREHSPLLVAANHELPQSYHTAFSPVDDTVDAARIKQRVLRALIDWIPPIFQRTIQALSSRLSIRFWKT